MDPRIPSSVQPLLQEYRRRLKADVPDLLFGVYLFGSIPYGAFSEDFSDIDVLTVTIRTCSAEDLARLAKIHSDIRAAWPRRKLEVSYVPREDCGWRPPEIAPAHPYHHQDPYYGDGELHESGIFDFNSPIWAANVWWMVKTRSITLLGPPPAALDIQVSAADIVATSRNLVENHWPDWLRPHRNLLQLQHPFTVDWVVFGMLRCYYTLREGDLTSKLGAAEYGLARLPKRWHWLINDSLESRARPVPRGNAMRVYIGFMTALYLRFMLRECQRIIARD